MRRACCLGIAAQLAVFLAAAAPAARAAAAPAVAAGSQASGPTGTAGGLPALPAAAVAPPAALPAPLHPRVRRVPPNELIAVLGQPVSGSDGKKIGRLTDVLVDAAGVPEAAVIDFGGFMGVGSRTVAVRWGTLRFHPGKRARISITLLPAEIGAAPQYKGTRRPAPVVVEHLPPPASVASPAPASPRDVPARTTPRPAVASTAPAAPSTPTAPQVAIPFDAPATTLSTNPLADPLATPLTAPLAAPPVAAPSGETNTPR